MPTTTGPSGPKIREYIISRLEIANQNLRNAKHSTETLYILGCIYGLEIALTFIDDNPE